MPTSRDLINVFAQKARFEAVDLQESAGQIRILGRLHSDGTTSNISNWLLVQRHMRQRSSVEGCPWKVDVSKYYFEKGDKTVYAWRVVLQAPGIDVRTCLADVIQAAKGAQVVSHGTVEEVPLLGASKNRNMPVRGKGAGSVNEAPPIASLVGRQFGGA